MLVTLRKGFITFNALIGMYMVYKTTGYNTDNFISCFYTMGHTYGEIFLNFNKRLFTWIYDLFDHKRVPNVSGNPPSNPSSWFSPRIESAKPSWFSGPYNNITPGTGNGVESLRKTYVDEMLTNPFNVPNNNTPWYRDVTTLLLIGGTLASIGVFYVGYKMIMDPLFINDLPVIGNWFKSTPDIGNVANVAAVTVTSPDGSITPTNMTQPEFVQGSSSSVTKSIITTIGSGLKKLNPVTWFMSSVDLDANERAFRVAQSNDGFDNRFYPFTNVYPYDPWFKRMRISLFGETVSEEAKRLAIRNTIFEDLMPALNVTPQISSTPLTPTITTVGLGLNLTNMDTGFMTVASKLSSVANTPTHLPVQLPEMVNAFNNPVEEAIERLKGYVSPEVTSPRVEASSSVIKSSVIIAPVTSPIVESIATLLSWFFKLK